MTASSPIPPGNSRKRAGVSYRNVYSRQKASNRQAKVAAGTRRSGQEHRDMTKQPLSGVRVLEVGNYLAGPFCGMQLADLGAEVIKIEPPDGGDQVRSIAPLLDGEGSAFVRLNRNKRSLALNLKSVEGNQAFRQLVGTADVVVENLRPGTMADLELGYDALRRLNPGLVYVAASGWGQDGPLSAQPGLAILAQAR